MAGTAEKDRPSEPVVEKTPAPTNQFRLLDMLAEPQVLAPPGFKVTYAILTAPFSITAIMGGAKEEKVLTAVILNYETEQVPWSLELNDSTVYATLKSGESVEGTYFVFKRWLVENIGEGSMEYKLITVTINDSKETLNVVGLGSVKALSSSKQNYAWFLFPISESSTIAEVSLGNLKEAQGKK